MPKLRKCRNFFENLEKTVITEIGKLDRFLKILISALLTCLIYPNLEVILLVLST